MDQTLVSTRSCRNSLRNPPVSFVFRRFDSLQRELAFGPPTIYFYTFFIFSYMMCLFQRACATEDTILKYILYLGLPYLYMVFGAVINGRMEELMCNATCRRKCRWSLPQKDLWLFHRWWHWYALFWLFHMGGLFIYYVGRPTCLVPRIYMCSRANKSSHLKWALLHFYTGEARQSHRNSSKTDKLRDTLACQENLTTHEFFRHFAAGQNQPKMVL